MSDETYVLEDVELVSITFTAKWKEIAANGNPTGVFMGTAERSIECDELPHPLYEKLKAFVVKALDK